MTDNTSLKDALEYVAKLRDISHSTELEKHYAENPTIDIEGRLYYRKSLEPVLLPIPKQLALNSLDGLITYINETPDIKEKEKIMITVGSPSEISVFGPLQGSFLQRSWYIRASCDVPTYPFDKQLGLEEFIIALQTQFLVTQDRGILISLVSNITSEASVDFSDDGASQTVTAKSGITRVANMPVPNPVNLKPYRTFIEVDQPESNFLFRLKREREGSSIYASLREADGGAWKMEAMASIRGYLKDQLLQGIVI